LPDVSFAFVELLVKTAPVRKACLGFPNVAIRQNQAVHEFEIGIDA